MNPLFTLGEEFRFMTPADSSFSGYTTWHTDTDSAVFTHGHITCTSRLHIPTVYQRCDQQRENHGHRDRRAAPDTDTGTETDEDKFSLTEITVN